MRRRGLADAALLALLSGLVVVATVTGSLIGGTTAENATVNGLVLLILVVGLGVFVSNSGVFAFGHAAFMGVGAYVTAILTLSDAQQRIQLGDLPPSIAALSVPPPVAVLVSAFAAGLFALFVSLPLVRLSGLTASLATVAVLITMRVVFQNLETYTRGTRGLILDAPRPSIVQILLWSLAAIAAALAFKRSAMGIRLAASREDEFAARSVGIRVWWERGVAFVLSAAITGAGGALFALYFRSLNPDSFYLSVTFTVVAMLVIGGLTSLSGAVVGALTLTTVIELLRFVERGVVLGPVTVPARPGLTEVGMALVLLIILIVRPAGITGGRELLHPRRSLPAGPLGGSADGSGGAAPAMAKPESATAGDR